MKRKVDASYRSGHDVQAKRRALSTEHAQALFRDGLFTAGTLSGLREGYENSQPFKHGVINNLIDQTLLRSVRDEIRANISFTPKETDIYKIHQSGDLANLDGLDDASLELLPSLVTLRDALYSVPFRQYLSHVTGSGPLSGAKTDMAVNVYTPSCHLLCHDDVIGSRRVSYILYLTNPDQPWRPEWGGALRLYPTVQMEDGSGIKLPSSEWSQSIPPAFNQLSFFAVQPGESFHDVEEVYFAGKGLSNHQEEERIRMAISGWYHIPQPGEDGYEEGAEAKQAEKSSLAQLQGNATEYDLPQPQWVSHDEDIPGRDTKDAEDSTQLTEDDLNLLLRFINPRYLIPETVEELAEKFAQDSSLHLGTFLSETFAASLRAQIEGLQAKSTLADGWNIARPPHKHRYRYLQPTAMQDELSSPLHEAVRDLLPSLAFRKWLALATDLTLDDCDILARRFRRGLDYTLATPYNRREPQLELCLSITPSRGWGPGEDGNVNDHETDGDGEDVTRLEVDADGSNPGGYEIYLAGDDDLDDKGDRAQSSASMSTHTGAGERRGGGSKGKNLAVDPAVYSRAGDDEDDGILLSLPPSWNTLSVVLRDRGTLRFVKYVSQNAPSDRWDMFGIWKVEENYDDDDDDDDDDDADDGESGMQDDEEEEEEEL